VIGKGSDNTLKVKLHKGVSYNGPVTSYQVVVVVGLGTLDQELLEACTKFAESSCNYYIAAEIPAQVIFAIV